MACDLTGGRTSQDFPVLIVPVQIMVSGDGAAFGQRLFDNVDQKSS